MTTDTPRTEMEDEYEFLTPDDILAMKLTGALATSQNLDELPRAAVARIELLERELAAANEARERAEETVLAKVRADPSLARGEDGSLRLPNHCALVLAEEWDRLKAAEARALKAAEEMRERCARACEDIDDRCPDCAAHNEHDQCIVPLAWQYADAIRALPIEEKKDD